MALDFDFLIQTIRSVDRKHISVLSTAIITVATAWWVGKVIKRSKGIKSLGGKKIPMPKGQYFYLGHLPLLGKYPGFKATEWHKELGPIFQINAGAQQWVFVGDPKAAHEIFVSKGAACSGRPFLTYATEIHSDGYKGIAFVDDHKRWRTLRSAVIHMYSPQSIDSVSSTIETITRKSVELLIENNLNFPKDGIDPMKYARLASTSNMFATIFGICELLCLDDPLYKELNEATEKHLKFFNATNDLSATFPILSFLDFLVQRESKMRDFVHKKHRPLYEKLIEKARENDRPSLIKRLDQMKESSDISEIDIIVSSIDAMVGGTDATSFAICFALAILCHYPDWQKKMQTEIDNFVKKQGRMPKYTERSKLPVVLAVMKETLRYKSSAALGVPHKTSEDIVYRDYIIPKDTIVFGNAHTANNCDMFYNEPEKFNPERFMNDSRSIYSSSKSAVDTREVFNFGWGRRMCPGIYLAENETFSWLCHIAARCTIEPTISSNGEMLYPEIEDIMDFGGLLSPVPFKIRFVERQS
ncbi:cytochrome P450 [Sporodiniella umbellata]|nr:cytochrome P450 [Sporodiniella umbellata]